MNTNKIQVLPSYYYHFETSIFMLPLFSNCFKNGMMTPVHEILHTLGFVHEHTRPDRDSFVDVNTDNILPGKVGNFKKRLQGYSDYFEEGSVNSQNSPYDVLSVLHYGPQDFSKNGKDVITFLHGLPDQTWPAPDPEDPLSLIDQVSILLKSFFISLCSRWSWEWHMGAI